LIFISVLNVATQKVFETSEMGKVTFVEWDRINSNVIDNFKCWVNFLRLIYSHRLKSREAQEIRVITSLKNFPFP
jgi:hypothetical protein